MGAGASLNLPQNLQNDELMQETYQKIRMLFKELDKVGHGLISRNDFYEVCETIPGHFVSPEEMQQAFKYNTTMFSNTTNNDNNGVETVNNDDDNNNSNNPQ